MTKPFGMVAGILLLALTAHSASAHSAPAPRADSAARLTEAHAIIKVMFPPTARQQMMDKMMADMTAPMRQSMPMKGISDPGLKAIFQDYTDHMFGEMHLMIDRHLPDMTDAMAVAYTHQFSLTELKDIHAFALTPSGRDYFSHATTIISDPAVKKVMVNMMADAQQLSRGSLTSFKEKLTAYLKTHPAAAKQMEDFASAQSGSK